MGIPQALMVIFGGLLRCAHSGVMWVLGIFSLMISSFLMGAFFCFGWSWASKKSREWGWTTSARANESVF